MIVGSVEQRTSDFKLRCFKVMFLRAENVGLDLLHRPTDVVEGATSSIQGYAVDIY